MKLWLTTSALFLFIHTLEDIALLSIGRFSPLPWWAMYAVGLGASTLVMAFLVRRLLGVKHGH